ncbi:MAG: hypothetical protein HOO06_15060 [Bdellovibrionaceae bacterium]|jgi:hypothetical protein|nr:hypothetical protein [Pseudobdellovibrionaceae bacterium]
MTNFTLIKKKCASDFHNDIKKLLPNVFNELDPDDIQNFSILAGTVRNHVEKLINNDEFEKAKIIFTFIEKYNVKTEPEINSALETCFFYDFSIGDQTSKQKNFVRSHLSENQKIKLSDYNDFWK